MYRSRGRTAIKYIYRQQPLKSHIPSMTSYVPTLDCSTVAPLIENNSYSVIYLETKPKSTYFIEEMAFLGHIMNLTNYRLISANYRLISAN